MIKLFLGAFLESAVGFLARKVLISLGIGMLSFAAVSFTLQTLIDASRTQFGSLPQLALAIVGLSGLSDGLGIICGALMYKAALMNMPRLGFLQK